MVLNTLSRSLKVTLAVLLSVVSTGLLQTAPAYATQPEQPKKVFVCKYVGTPHVDERLQTGDNPISVSVNSIQQNQWDGAVPGWFSDAHDRSYVLSYDNTNPGPQDDPSVSQCPPAETPEKPAPVVVPLSEDRSTCEAGVEQRLGNITTDWVYDQNNGTWVAATPVTTWGSWVFVRNLTPQEKVQLNCAKPEKPAPIVEQVREDSKTCAYGVWHRNGTKTTNYVWDAQTWSWVASSPTTVWGSWVFDRPLTNAEKAELNCRKPHKPSDKTWTTKDYDKSCEDGLTKTITTYTKTYTFDVDTWSWVPTVTSEVGEPIHIRSLTSLEKLQLHCDKPEKPEKVVKTFDKTRKSCENGVESKTITIKKKYVFNYIKWEWVPVVHVSHSDWTYVRDLTDAEKTELDCVTPPVEEPEEPETPGQVLGNSDDKTPPQVLATSTEMPATIPATGGESTGNPYLILVAGLVAYGAVYFLQGRRQLNKN